ncbi:VOC family protein [Mycolicibacterium komossense]|uniref:VOC family protein n=1 Tax=Mycolicibacterium komossense TaxID=1779 RepID=A0ABT3C938_9MYCO|nr:VOC family protein [Mycolicibacterium komossense]MCV7225982.1 VOC family protein [Mycolicibacterium komossense]
MSPDEPALAIADFYHVGIVVPDLDSAAQRLTAIAGYAWTKPVEFALSVVTAAGECDLVNRFVYSLQAPHLELVQEVPGTVWTAPAHHLGYWVDDIGSAAAQLEQAGCTQEARPSGQALSTFAYYTDPAGIRIELVDRALFPDWPAFLAAMAG